VNGRRQGWVRGVNKRQELRDRDEDELQRSTSR
jgi:hypothetical protein